MCIRYRPTTGLDPQARANLWDHIRSESASWWGRALRGRLGRRIRRLGPGRRGGAEAHDAAPVSYTHPRAHETVLDSVCRLLLEKKKITQTMPQYFTHLDLTG